MPSRKADDNAIIFSKPMAEVDAWEASEGMSLPNGDFDGLIVMSEKWIDEKNQQIIAARYKVVGGEYDGAKSVIDYIYVTPDSEGKVKQWLESATGKEVKGKKIPDITKMVGKNIRFVVQNEVHKGKTRNKFSNYRPYDKDAPAPGALGGGSTPSGDTAAPEAASDSDDDEVELI